MVFCFLFCHRKTERYGSSTWGFPVLSHNKFPTPENSHFEPKNWWFVQSMFLREYKGFFFRFQPFVRLRVCVYTRFFTQQIKISENKQTHRKRKKIPSFLYRRAPSLPRWQTATLHLSVPKPFNAAFNPRSSVMKLWAGFCHTENGEKTTLGYKGPLNDISTPDIHLL